MCSLPFRGSEQRANGACFLWQLILNGRRKSIEATATRLPDGNEQNLRQFVNQSTWDPGPVQLRFGERQLPPADPVAWVVGVGSMPKDGRMSRPVWLRGTLGRRANCQVAVGVRAAADTASCALQWRLFLPQ